jgi:hypothetical protein
MFPQVGKHGNNWENIENHKFSATMFPSLPRAVRFRPSRFTVTAG